MKSLCYCYYGKKLIVIPNNKVRIRTFTSNPTPKIIVGLGNPIPQYQFTRHNVGEECIHHWIKQRSWGESVVWEEKKLKDEVIQYGTTTMMSLSSNPTNHTEVIFITLPKTFINVSGIPIKRFLTSMFSRHQLTINCSSLLIIQDDMSGNVGKARIKLGGSAAGHNGIKSIIDLLGTMNFARLCIGIGRPGMSRDSTIISDFVISKFTEQERTTLLHVGIPIVLDLIEGWINDKNVIHTNVMGKNKGINNNNKKKV
jgi:PTH1 family peptidyl-tRNA hydrolase